MGRVTYSEAVADAFCELLADGKSERQACRVDGMPDRASVRRWRFAEPEFAAKCARAREEQAHGDVDRMRAIEARTLKGALDPAAARAVLSSIQWRASKLARAHYGDRTVLAGDPSAPLLPTTDAQLDERIAALLNKAGSDG